MNNVINVLLKDLYFKIPQPILMEGFADDIKQSNRVLDVIIKEKIIIDIVLSNCNLYAGKTKKIVLEERYSKGLSDVLLRNVFVGGEASVYAIPPEARENRPITAVLDVAFPTTMGLYGSVYDGSVSGRTVANGIDEALSSFTHTPAYITPSPILLNGEAGIIQLSPPSSLHVDWILSCLLAYDENFSNISLNMINTLKKMVEYATKAYIYNALWIKINQGFLQGGLQLESIRNIIEGYADSHEKFDEMVLKFRGASTFSHENLKDLLSLMIGS